MPTCAPGELQRGLGAAAGAELRGQLGVVARPALELRLAVLGPLELVWSARFRVADDALRALGEDPVPRGVDAQVGVLAQPEEVLGLDRGQRGGLGELAVGRDGNVIGEPAGLQPGADRALELDDVLPLHRRLDDDERAVDGRVL